MIRKITDKVQDWQLWSGGTAGGWRLALLCQRRPGRLEDSP